MKVIAGENWIELVPETDWEIDQLARLDKPRVKFTTELVEAPGDSYPPRMKKGAKMRIIFPTHDWGT